MELVQKVKTRCWTSFSKTTSVKTQGVELLSVKHASKNSRCVSKHKVLSFSFSKTTSVKTQSVELLSVKTQGMELICAIWYSRDSFSKHAMQCTELMWTSWNSLRWLVSLSKYASYRAAIRTVWTPWYMNTSPLMKEPVHRSKLSMVCKKTLCREKYGL